MSLADANIIQGYSIKETAERTGIPEDTIRYYEKIGPRRGRSARETATASTAIRIWR